MIKIDGVDYVKFSKYRDLEKLKTKIINKKVSPNYTNKDFMISDSVNVMAIVPIKKIVRGEQPKELMTDFGKMLEVNNYDFSFEGSSPDRISFKICGIRFSKNYLNKMRNIAHELLGCDWEDLRIYLQNKDGLDRLGLFVWGESLAFCLAPRVEEGDK